MEFRPCIDIHNGSVKQIVGSSLCDLGDQVKENFVAKQDAAFFARLSNVTISTHLENASGNSVPLVVFSGNLSIM